MTGESTRSRYSLFTCVLWALFFLTYSYGGHHERRAFMGHQGWAVDAIQEQACCYVDAVWVQWW